MKTLGNRPDLEETTRRIRNIRPDSVRQWGRMSPGQMVSHCADAFRAALGEKSVPTVRKFLGSTVLKWLALYAPFHWPKSVPTGAVIDPFREGSRPGDLATDVAELERLCHRFALSENQSARVTHPLFGPLSDAEWLRWGYLHQDHHLRQFGI